MKSSKTVVTDVGLLSAPVSKVIGWAAGCLLRCAADATARILQDPHSLRGGVSPLPVTPQGKS